MKKLHTTYYCTSMLINPLNPALQALQPKTVDTHLTLGPYLRPEQNIFQRFGASVNDKPPQMKHLTCHMAPLSKWDWHSKPQLQYWLLQRVWKCMRCLHIISHASSYAYHRRWTIQRRVASTRSIHSLHTSTPHVGAALMWNPARIQPRGSNPT